jgi:hypothetical protein
MARFDKWESGLYSLTSEYVGDLRDREQERRLTVWTIQDYLVHAAIDNGATAIVAGERVDELFGAYGGSWTIYVLTGANQIVTDIDTDTGIGWLDTEYPSGGGKTIRERVITQLEKTVD